MTESLVVQRIPNAATRPNVLDGLSDAKALRQIAMILADAADDKLATDPVIIDVTSREGQAEASAYIVASAPTGRQVCAIADEMMDQVYDKLGVWPRHVEGRTEGNWVLLDYGFLVVHIQTDEARQEYALTSLWADCPKRPLMETKPRSIFEAIGGNEVIGVDLWGNTGGSERDGLPRAAEEQTENGR